MVTELAQAARCSPPRALDDGDNAEASFSGRGVGEMEELLLLGDFPAACEAASSALAHMPSSTAVDEQTRHLTGRLLTVLVQAHVLAGRPPEPLESQLRSAFHGQLWLVPLRPFLLWQLLLADAGHSAAAAALLRERLRTLGCADVGGGGGGGGDRGAAGTGSEAADRGGEAEAVGRRAGETSALARCYVLDILGGALGQWGAAREWLRAQQTQQAQARAQGREDVGAAVLPPSELATLTATVDARAGDGGCAAPSTPGPFPAPASPGSVFTMTGHMSDDDEWAGAAAGEGRVPMPGGVPSKGLVGKERAAAAAGGSGSASSTREYAPEAPPRPQPTTCRGGGGSSGEDGGSAGTCGGRSGGAAASSDAAAAAAAAAPGSGSVRRTADWVRRLLGGGGNSSTSASGLLARLPGSLLAQRDSLGLLSALASVLLLFALVAERKALSQARQECSAGPQPCWWAGSEHSPPGSGGGGHQPGRGASSNGGALSSYQLNSDIKDCTSPDALLTLVERHGQAFSPINAATALSHAAQLCARQRCTIPHSGIEGMVQLAREQLPSMEARQLANTAWALAKLQHTDSAFMDALLKVGKPQLRDFKPRHLANTVWALATLGFADGDFMAALLEVAEPQLRDFKPQELANTVWALATLGFADGDFMAALLKAFTPQRRDFNPQAVQHGVGARDAGPRRRGLHGRALQGGHAAAAQLKPTGPGQYRVGARHDPQPSRVQLEVLAVVRQLPGCSGATSEQVTDDGLFSIDIAVQLPDGSRLAVEVDGPTHHLSSPLGRLNGAALLRNRLLEARGKRVVSVPVMTGWVVVAKKGQQAAQDYLLSLGVGPLQVTSNK
ncbi:hypothetical protein FOA52_011710 [Chlamydomonas sp. UWO 241]|nr:hypothetical protein FOA52_011710 [Chlamydomonas sp. UWO 241]